MRSSLRPLVLPVTVLCVLLLSTVTFAVDNSVAASPEAMTTTIPGPLRSFLRMAGISQKVRPEEVLPLLARNIYVHGYEGWQEHGRPTEFLILLNRYVQQARELSTLAGSNATIHVGNCEEAKPLLHILGYRVRGECGQDTVSLETAEQEKAFVTIDSGFPLAVLEKDLKEGKPFEYPFTASHVPVLLQDRDWLTKDSDNNRKDLVDRILRDRNLARLYWAFNHIDLETQSALRESPGIKQLTPLAAVLDFYGSHLRIRSGRIMVPGGMNAEPAWKDLVGASPEAHGDFVLHLLAKDKGWLAAYYDVLSRVNRAQQGRLTQTPRLKRYYEALRAHGANSDAAGPVFRPNPGMLLLATRLQWDENGEPHVPGNLEVWKKIFRQKSESKVVSDWGKNAQHFATPENLVEAMFGISSVETGNRPLQIYLLFSQMDTSRPIDHRLKPETIDAMAAKFGKYGHQYLIFNEFPELNDASVTQFLEAAESLDGISNHPLRGNALGTFEANVGIWQILARQGEIPTDKMNDSWQQTVKPFVKVGSLSQLFDAGSASLRTVLLAATGKAERTQDEIIDLLAGPHQNTPDERTIHQELANRMHAVLEGQRLVSLDTILSLGDNLHDMKQVKAQADTLIPLADELREFEMPQPIFRNSERVEWTAGVYDNRHTESQMRTDLTKVIKAPASNARLAEARGQLASFLRDTLVGLNYAYYEPPGAQMLHNNPLFIRSHDFSGESVLGMDRVWEASELFGVGSPAGGGAHLVGSLADLPYVLARVEQEFIAPENVQALIWQEVVPDLLASSIVPRWWGVTKNEMHAVTLYQRTGEELILAAGQDEKLRAQVLEIFASRLTPQRLGDLERAFRDGRVAESIPALMPSETFYLAAQFRQVSPAQSETWGAARIELEELTQRYPAELEVARLSRDFGVPHPILAQTYAPELLNVEPFPAFTGYSSRLLAESWDSSNLYWARLADEQGYSPVVLNRLVPQLTHRMIEKIFATDFEDWPALLRATRETGEEFRQGKIALLAPEGATSRH